MSRKKTDWPLAWFKLFLAGLLTLAGGLAFMLLVGIVHHEWIRECPTIGYWWVVAIAALLRSALYTADWNRGESS